MPNHSTANSTLHSTAKRDTNNAALSAVDSSADNAEILHFSQLLKACGDPLRVQVLQVLKRDTFGVLELTQLFETKQSGMSHHLKVLSKAGLVEAQREGNAIFYRRPFNPQQANDEQAIEQLFSLIDRFPLDEELETRITQIREQRAVQSRLFFERNSERFAEQQELISDYQQYADASLELLSKAKPDSDLTVMELGPGEGYFLNPLSQRYANIIALDNSANMLDKAQLFAAQAGLTNIEFRLGDTQVFKALNQQVDAVVMNMVLHHVPAPAEIFQDCFDFLNDDGVLLICDLSHHNQEWARENCGDLWLGFEPEQLTRWSESAGFIEDESVFIGLRNGFQIQLRTFIKSPAVLAVSERQANL